MKEASKAVEKGIPLATALDRTEIFPPILPQMIAVGEETGNLDVVLEKISEYYKEEVNTATQNLSAILEPLFLIVMGVTIGFIAMAVYMPMFQLTEVMT